MTAPDYPAEGALLTVRVVLWNEGSADAEVPVWLDFYLDGQFNPVMSSGSQQVTIPAGGETEIEWKGFKELTRRISSHILYPRVNVGGPYGWQSGNLYPYDSGPEEWPALASGFVDLLPAPPPSSPASWPPLVTAEPDVALRLERIFVTPPRPRQGEPFTVTAVVRNVGAVQARVPVWFSASRNQSSSSSSSSATIYVTLPAGEEAELHWDGTDRWLRSGGLYKQTSRLSFKAGVNVAPPEGSQRPTLLAEEDQSDNVAAVTVDLLPYEARVSDACPPNDNLHLAFPLDSTGQPSATLAHQVSASQSVLSVVVHNDGNSEVTRVPLRVVDAAGERFIAYARWVPPCGGAVVVGTQDGQVGLLADHLTFPVTVTLNPPDAPEALPESDHSDNLLVVNADASCAGPTDLWLAEDDVTLDGDDLSVTIHLSGDLPGRSFWVRAYHTDDGRVVVERQVSMTTCEPRTLRFEDALAGLQGGYLLVQIDTETHHVEAVYPQSNNAIVVPVP